VTAVPLRPDFVRRIGLTERIEAQTRPGTIARTAREEQRLDVLSGLNAFVLEQTDRVAARFGVEPRYPFWDRRLVEFCLALPGDQKLRDGYPRSIMRRALRDYLPPKVAGRLSKGNLLPSLHYSLLTHDRTVLQNAIREGPGAIAEYVDMDAVRAIWERYVQRRDGDDALAVWLVAVLEQWLRKVQGTVGTPGEWALSGSVASQRS
jgi:asparagine synthase (glutamine-hydrolysing)